MRDLGDCGDRGDQALRQRNPLNHENGRTYLPVYPN
jgi:hypothetical protein